MDPAVVDDVTEKAAVPSTTRAASWTSPVVDPRTRTERRHCHRCGYDLRGLVDAWPDDRSPVTETCPECGSEIAWGRRADRTLPLWSFEHGGRRLPLVTWLRTMSRIARPARLWRDLAPDDVVHAARLAGLLAVHVAAILAFTIWIALLDHLRDGWWIEETVEAATREAAFQIFLPFALIAAVGLPLALLARPVLGRAMPRGPLLRIGSYGMLAITLLMFAWYPIALLDMILAAVTGLERFLAGWDWSAAGGRWPEEMPWMTPGLAWLPDLVGTAWLAFAAGWWWFGLTRHAGLGRGPAARLVGLGSVVVIVCLIVLALLAFSLDDERSGALMRMLWPWLALA